MTDELNRGFKVSFYTYHYGGEYLGQTGFERGGLVVVELNDRPGWLIYPRRCDDPVAIPKDPMTKEEALDIASELLELPVNWSLSRREIAAQVKPHLKHILTLFNS
jgi:hypothetical protein